MTVRQDVQRASLRAMMAVPMFEVPEYSADPNVLVRVGDVIGETAGHKERHVRASDSLTRSTSRVTTPVQTYSGLSMWPWAVSMITAFGTVGLLVVLIYWHFG